MGSSDRWAPVCGDGWGVREGMVSACELKYVNSFFFPPLHSAEHFLVSSNFQKDMTFGFDSAKISWNVTSATFHIPADARTRDQVGFVLFLPESHRSSARKEVNIEQRASVGSKRKLTLQFEC